MLDYLFVLPDISRKPIGGYKVIYEYSNRLSLAGFKVGILHVGITRQNDVFTRLKIKSLLSSLIKLIGIKSDIRWFNMNRSIELYYSVFFRTASLPKTDIIVATAWDTASLADSALQRGKARKGFYLIQGFEDWSADAHSLFKSYNLGLDDIAVSRWLQEIVKSSGAACHYIPNGLNHEDFYLENPISSRNNEIGMTLYHPQKSKGFEITLDACRLIKVNFPNFKLLVFGAYRPSMKLPSWIEFHLLPNTQALRKLYNTASIYISSSLSEGWGLTASEAQQCGCTLIASDIPGHREFAVDQINCLLSEPDNIDSLVSNITELIENPDKRIRLAVAGNISIKKFDWKDSVTKFISITGNLDE